MKIKQLKIENYKSFRYLTTIDFPVVNGGQSVFLVGGMNGAGKTSITEAIEYCLYGVAVDRLYKNINRKELAKGNAAVMFELTMETDEGADLIVKRSWDAGALDKPRPRDLAERLVVVKDGKRVSIENKEMWQSYIRTLIPPGITQFFFFDGEKIQEIAADDHAELKLKTSLEAALGIQYINRLSEDLAYIKTEARKDFYEITDEDLEFKQGELRRDKSRLAARQKERAELQSELNGFNERLSEAKKRFESIFHSAPETREALREREKRRLAASNRVAQIDMQVRQLCTDVLPFALAGKLFPQIRQQIDAERESASGAAIREHAAELAKRIVRAVEEPEPIYRETLSAAKMDELEKRIERILKEGDGIREVVRVLGLSDRDAARVLNCMEEIEHSEIFLVKTLLDEKSEQEMQVKKLEAECGDTAMTDSERELFIDLQKEIEECTLQIGRKTEKLNILSEEVLAKEKKIRETELEVEKLYQRYNISKEKSAFLESCDAIATVLQKFIVRLRKNKVQMLEDKTFEMYKRLSSRGDLVSDLVIDDKTYEIAMKDRGGNEIKRRGLSAGEKEVFAISLLWGLAQTSQLRLPIIIDTPLSRLDSTHRDNVVNHYFSNAGEQVVILSTDTEIDTDYYRKLKPHLAGAGRLDFNSRQELTEFRVGYFWEA